ncbi:hypothetical protein FRC18_010470 [Serendipita sp. 400]|nr:hypothetical protein FRC18_010470 [Serendipita sp. 400]
MFKKDFKNLKNRVPLRNSEILALRRGIASRFVLSEEESSLLVPSSLLSAKFLTHLELSGTVVFDSEGTPIWFQNGTGRLVHTELVPTVYTLWKRVFLPVFTTPQMVIDKLRDGADLMAPGVISIRPSHFRQLPMEEGELVCIAAYSQDGDQPPVAVGQLGMSTKKIEETGKGKAVLTLHTYGDTLWQKGGKQEPPKEITIVSLSAAVEEPEPQIHAPQTDVNEPTAGLSEGGTSSSNHQLSQAQANPVETLAASDVDDILRNALLYYIHASFESLSFPYSASVLYAEGILPFRPSDTNPSEAVIKNSSFKKLKPFLKSIEKDGILKLKEIGGELNIMAVDEQHSDVQGVKKYRTLADEDKREAKARAIEESQAANAKVMTIQELYKPIGNTTALFNAVKASSTSQYSIIQLRDDDLRKLCAAQTSISPVLGKPNLMEVLVQGKQGKAVTDYLLEHGIPKKWIEVDDTTEKKKGK